MAHSTPGRPSCPSIAAICSRTSPQPPLSPPSIPASPAADDQTAHATRALPAPKIRDISVIECQPQGVRLTVVKITTDQPGLYGYGCATFTQRADLVKPAVELYLKPFLAGQNH